MRSQHGKHSRANCFLLQTTQDPANQAEIWDRTQDQVPGTSHHQLRDPCTVPLSSLGSLRASKLTYSDLDHRQSKDSKGQGRPKKRIQGMRKRIQSRSGVKVKIGIRKVFAKDGC